jgi:hypothetical protein
MIESQPGWSPVPSPIVHNPPSDRTVSLPVIFIGS